MSTIAPVVRLAGLDRLRGLAIACMVIDHAALVAGIPVLRYTIGRLAVPIFFMLAGALVRRLTWRHVGVAVIGVLLPLWVRWIDSPNVLLLYAAGAVVVVAGRRWAWWPWAVLAACLTVLANGWGHLGHGYPPAAVWALLAAGSLAGRYVGLGRVSDAARRLPGWLGGVGRYPVSIYVVHLLVLDFVVTWAAAGGGAPWR